MRVASCCADISSEKNPTMPPLTDSMRPSGRTSPSHRLGDVVGDVGGERRLAHAGAAGQDDEVGALQPAHHAVEVAQPGGEPGQLAVALIGMGRHLDGGGQRLGEALEAAVVAAGLRQFVEIALGLLDLVLGPRIDRRIIGGVDEVLADPDQRAAQREVVDGTAVVGGIDDGGGFGGEAREVLADRQAGDVDVGRQKGLEGDRGRGLADAHQRRGDLVHLLMDRLEEMPRLEKVGDPVERLVVHQDGAEQSLLQLDVVRCRAIKRRCFRKLLACSRFECHDVPFLF